MNETQLLMGSTEVASSATKKHIFEISVLVLKPDSVHRLKSALISLTALPNFLAKVGLGIFAEFAFTTLWHIQRDDSITLVKKN